MNLQSAAPSSQARRVSVVVPSYNHERFITSALESVARQAYTDYDVSILDDASSDHSVEKIQAFIAQHPEIACSFTCHERNQGGVITLNDLIQHSQGAYIALINSDDCWKPDKLEKQVRFLDEHPEVGAVFTQADVIDEDGKLITNPVDFSADIFRQKNRSRGAWLKRLFFELNCLCHPSMLIRRSVYEQVGLYNPRLKQLPDMEMWVRVLKHTAIHIIEEPLVLLRSHSHSTSQLSIETTTRNLNELSFLLEGFFDGIPNAVMIEGFRDLFRSNDASQPEALDCEKAFLYLLPQSVMKTLYHHIGLHQLYRLMGRPETRSVLNESYNFRYEDLFALDGTLFFDDHLIAFRHLLDSGSGPAARAQNAHAWRYFINYNRDFLLMNLRKYPSVYFPLRRFFGFFRGARK